jgi:hypothetical protein
MNIRNYIERAASKRGLSAEAVSSRVLGGLAIAGIRESDEATASSRTAVDSLLARLEKKLGKSARVVAEPTPVVTRPRRAGSVPNPKTLRKQPVEVQTDDFDANETASYANALRKGIDPATGAKLNEIELMPGVKSLHNPSTRVVYPIPGNNALPGVV